MRTDLVIDVSFLLLMVLSFWFARRFIPGSRFDFPGVLLFDESFQVGETRAPETAVLLDPGVDVPEWFRIELIDAIAAFAMLAHQMGATQQAKVLRDGRTRNRESFCYLSGRLASAAEKVEDGPASRVGKSLESGLRAPCWRICNRTVTHNA
jgi:hypothetical protein